MCEKASLIQDDRMATEPGNDAHHVLDYHYRHTRRIDLPDQFHHLVGIFQTESGHRLVQEENVRPTGKRTGNLDAATPNRLATRVAAIDFLGPFCRARLDLEAAPGLSLQADFSANLMRDLGVTEGQALTISLPPEALRVFAKSERP